MKKLQKKIQKYIFVPKTNLILFFLLFTSQLNCRVKSSQQKLYKQHLSGKNLKRNNKSKQGIFPSILEGIIRIPSGVEPIKNFEFKKYYGTWYEVVRIDNIVQRGQKEVIEINNKNESGYIDVVNIGTLCKNNKKKILTAELKPLRNSKCDGHLKISFMKPLYSSFIIFYVEHEDNDTNKNYNLVMITSFSKKLLWILSKKKQIKEKKIKFLLNYLKELGFDTKSFVCSWSKHQSKPIDLMSMVNK